MDGDRRRALAFACVILIGGLTTPAGVTAQSLPAPVRVALETGGHDDFADRLSDRMDPRSSLDRGDVEDLLERWDDASGGPADGWDWLAAARLWLRAGEPERAHDALKRADGLAPGLLALEEARIDFLAGRDEAAAMAYWRACEQADELSMLEAWRDIEVLATPEEVEEFDRFRRLPAGQRDDCAFLRSFWNRRAARSGTSTDERVALHYERLRFAMDHYVRRGRAQDVSASGKLNARLGREGAPRFDDRGLLYVRMGPPDETTRSIGGDCFEPNVSWYYRYGDGEHRMYHLSPIGGNDNWWLLGNLGEIFRCQVDAAGNIRSDRNPMVALSASLDDVPADAMYELYTSRAQLDPRYARFAYAFARRAVEILQDERELTWEDGRFAVADIPERPDVRLDVETRHEWVAFRLPMPERTRMWLFLLVSGDDLRDIDPPPDDGFEVAVTALDPDGGQAYASARFEAPPPGSDAIVRLPFDLSPGAYEARVVVRSGPPRRPGDADREQPSGSYTSAPITVPGFRDALPRLSQIAVSPDSGGAWTHTDELAISPSPIHVPNADGVLWIYFEAYNLTPGGRYLATVRLEPEDGATPFELEFTGLARPEARIVTPAGLRVDLGGTASGTYELSLTVRDQATGRVTLPARTEVRVP